MEFIKIKCPICGGDNSFEDNGDKNRSFKCGYCGDSLLPRKSSTPKKSPVVTSKPVVSVASSNPGVLSPKDLFSLARKTTINLYSNVNNEVICGTGIFISDEYVLTNAHVLLVQGQNGRTRISDDINGRFADEKSMFSLEFVYADKEKDLAVLRSSKRSERSAKFFKGEVATGEKVYAIGNAKGLGLSIIDGLVSKASMVGPDDEEYIMFSAPVNHGNSGGPLYNENGQVIGVVTFGLEDANLMNYAIPSNRVFNFIKYTESQEEVSIL